ncbi:MAG: hypothetical protein U5K00_14635 [Melioribacteraceae bacterium]|nr:hypothetical protein [Melioribacteraceae bacterium]
MKEKRVFIISLLISFIFVSCSIYETAQNFARLQFNVDSYNNFRLANINLEGKDDIDDLSTMDYVKLTGGFVKGELPFSFVINVSADNPNDGTGGFPPTDLSVQSFPFRVLLDDKQILSGNIDEPFTVPGMGEQKIIPIRVDVDILDFFKNKSFEELANFILAVSGEENARSRISLFAKPVIGSPVGNIEYPEEIKISYDVN